MMRTATLTILALLLTACASSPDGGVGWTRQDTVRALKLGLRIAQVKAFERVETGKLDRADYDLLVAAAEAGIKAYEQDGAIDAREAAWILIDALAAAALDLPPPAPMYLGEPQHG